MNNIRRIRHRLCVRLFADHMEKILRANDHKGGWDGCSKEFLVSKLLEEVQELIRESLLRNRKSVVVREAADVANIAMMIADNTGELGAVLNSVEHEKE